MARVLIEVPHDVEQIACARVVKIFLSSGSHFLTHADWGCQDGVHSAWFIADVASKDEALQIVPPNMRSEAKVIALNAFSMDYIERILSTHRP
jgi:hypothetical protein